MSFFDKKSEVINIELTPYGKYLLSQGKFKPAYYEFYDDDILYDSEYAGFTEKQETIQQRIRETSRPKVQYSFEGAETRYKEYRKQVREQQNLNIPIIEKRKNFSLTSLPLANSAVGDGVVPSTKIKLLKGEISSSASSEVLGIPRGVREIELYPQSYNIYLREKTAQEVTNEGVILEDEGGSSLLANYESDREVLEVTVGDSLVEITKESNYLFFDITETGVPLGKDNFDMFLYEMEYDPVTETEIEKQLYFIKPRTNIENNILLDDEQNETGPINVERDMTEYYFSILTDKDIPDNIFCEHLVESEIERLNQVEGYDIDCKAVKLIQKLENPELFITEQEIRDNEEC